jgi:thiol-disulfide isomerase/thioredoxin
METPKVPEGTHYLPDGKVDSNFGYYYYKAHYWDGFSLKDDRLIHTPLLEMKLEEYFNKMLIQQEDTICKYADTILNKMKGTEDLYKFTLNWLSTNAQTSKVMGMDKVFVYLVENYYMKGVATWLSTEDLKKFIDRANELAPTLMNKKAADFTGIDLNKKELNLYSVKAKYTLVVFYDPDCGHCQGEMPHLDSLYYADLKERGVKVIAFNVDKEEQKWKDFLKKYKMEDWINVYDPERKSLYWRYYDVQATPSIYLLDEGKIIRGKKLDYTTISKAIEINEMRHNGKTK